MNVSLKSIGHKTINNKSKNKKKAYNEKPIGFIGMLIRFSRARKARLEDEGLLEMRLYNERKKELVRETKIETTLQSKFQKEVDSLMNGETNFFTIVISPKAYPYFELITKSPEYQLLDIREVGEFEYTVSISDDIFNIETTE